MHEFRSSIRSGVEKPATPVARKAKPKSESQGLGGLTKIAIRREEARITDQRCEDRHFNVVEDCVIGFRRRKRTVRVINVSSRGAMIESDIEARIGEGLDIQFSEQAKTRCVVRWIREGRIGVEFVNETIFWEAQPSGPVFQYQPEEARSESRRPREVIEREPRQTLLRKGSLYWGGITVPVRLRNISAGGAKVESERELQPGAEVELDLGEAGFQIAEVRWSKDGQVGLRFVQEFDLDSLAPGSTAEGGSPASGMLKPAYLETETRPDSPWAARFERLSMTDLKMTDPRD